MDRPRAPRKYRITRLFQPADVIEACVLSAVATSQWPPDLDALCGARGLANVPVDDIERALDRLVRQGMIETCVLTNAHQHDNGRLTITPVTTYRLGPKAVVNA